MRTIHFCHLTDTHLGNRQYGLVERFDDYGEALKNALEKIAELSPDFVIHTGDLFDVSKPQAPELRQAVRLFQSLKDKEIPLYMSQGNHDVSYSKNKRYGGDILHFLADLDLFNYIQNNIVYFPSDEEPQVLLFALNYYGKRSGRVLQTFLKNYESELSSFDGPKILMLHAFVAGMPANKDLEIESFAKYGFDYVGVGHLHEKWENTNYNIYCPGSTEHTSTTEWAQPERGFYDVCITQNENGTWKTQANFVEIPTREKVEVRHRFTSLSVQEIREEAEEILLANDREGIVLKCVFFGEYKGKEHPFINLDKYKSTPKKCLHTIISTKFLPQEQEQEKHKPLSQRETYQRVLEGTYFLNPEITDDFISLLEAGLGIIADGRVADQEELLDKQLTKFASRNKTTLLIKEV